MCHPAAYAACSCTFLLHDSDCCHWRAHSCHHAHQVANDPNMFGVMMVRVGDADGMVSGAIHTTAATIRPAMQVRMQQRLLKGTRTRAFTAIVGHAMYPVGREAALRAETPRLQHINHGVPAFAYSSVDSLLHCTLQVLKADLVSSVFFMCLPDKVNASTAY